jgi:hypothetical protein
MLDSFHMIVLNGYKPLWAEPLTGKLTYHALTPTLSIYGEGWGEGIVINFPNNYGCF